MDIDQFRANPINTSRLSEIFSDPVFKLAMEILRNSNEPIDPNPSEPEIASVRMLSQMLGFNTYAKMLQSMCFPIIPMQEIPTEFKPEVMQQ